MHVSVLIGENCKTKRIKAEREYINGKVLIFIKRKNFGAHNYKRYENIGIY
jgi:hypothetical protein